MHSHAQSRKFDAKLSIFSVTKQSINIFDKTPRKTNKPLEFELLASNFNPSGSLRVPLTCHTIHIFGIEIRMLGNNVS